MSATVVHRSAPAQGSNGTTVTVTMTLSEAAAGHAWLFVIEHDETAPHRQFTRTVVKVAAAPADGDRVGRLVTRQVHELDRLLSAGYELRFRMAGTFRSVWHCDLHAPAGQRVLSWKTEPRSADDVADAVDRLQRMSRPKPVDDRADAASLAEHLRDVGQELADEHTRARLSADLAAAPIDDFLDALEGDDRSR